MKSIELGTMVKAVNQTTTPEFAGAIFIPIASDKQMDLIWIFIA